MKSISSQRFGFHLDTYKSSIRKSKYVIALKSHFNLLKYNTSLKILSFKVLKIIIMHFSS